MDISLLCSMINATINLLITTVVKVNDISVVVFSGSNNQDKSLRNIWHKLIIILLSAVE